MSSEFSPPFTPAAAAERTLRERAAVVLSPSDFSQAVGVACADLLALRAHWDVLAPDQHLKDGGRYRQRRHSCFVIEGGAITQTPHRAHWQPVEYNALHGGIERWFEPMAAAMVQSGAWQGVLGGLAKFADAIRPGVARWCVEAHPFRIDTAGGIGRPTPEGAHRDGVDLVVVCLVGRHGIKGGETRVFDAHGPNGQRYTLSEPWTTLLLDDARVIHETTPIQPLDAASGGHRDTLVLTYRAGAFQGPGT
jgi:hypothetical protein